MASKSRNGNNRRNESTENLYSSNCPACQTPIILTTRDASTTTKENAATIASKTNKTSNGSHHNKTNGNGPSHSSDCCQCKHELEKIKDDLKEKTILINSLKQSIAKPCSSSSCQCKPELAKINAELKDKTSLINTLNERIRDLEKENLQYKQYQHDQVQRQNLKLKQQDQIAAQLAARQKSARRQKFARRLSSEAVDQQHECDNKSQDGARSIGPGSAISVEKATSNPTSPVPPRNSNAQPWYKNFIRQDEKTLPPDEIKIDVNQQSYTSDCDKNSFSEIMDNDDSSLISNDNDTIITASSGPIQNFGRASQNVINATFMAPVKGAKVVFKGSKKAVSATGNVIVGTGQVIGHIGEQTGKVVLKGSKKVVKTSAKTVVGTSQAIVGVTVGTAQGIGHFGEQTTTLLGKGIKKSVKTVRKITLIGGGSAPRSKWDEAVDIITELLQTDSEPYKAMTSKQRSRLYDVKKFLIMGAQGQKQESTLHIPIGLLGEGSTSFRRDSIGESTEGVVRGGKDVARRRGSVVDRKTISYIIGEYGGVKVDDNASKNASVATDETVSSDGHSFDEESMFYTPPEFDNLPKEQQKMLYRMLSWSSIDQWDFNIFNLVKITGDCNPLLFMGYAIIGSPHSQYSMAQMCGEDADLSISDFVGYNFVESKLKIQLKKLCDYLREIEKDYRPENPYHNSIHAADVLQSLHSLVQMAIESDALDIENMGLHDDQTNNDLFSILLAAAVHDVGHPGFNNSYQVNSKTELALLYNDMSVLENLHASHAFMKMFASEKKQIHMPLNNSTNKTDLNILSNASKEDVNYIRGRMIECILHTDMKTHFQTVNALKGLILKQGVNASANDDGEILLEMDPEFEWQVFLYMLHMADLSGQARPRPLCLDWGTRCLDEFFIQGDKEAQLKLPISPNCNRHTTKIADSQFGFISFVVLPAYEVLGAIIPPVKEDVLPIVAENLRYWENQKMKAEATEAYQSCQFSVPSEGETDEDSKNTKDSKSTKEGIEIRHIDITEGGKPGEIIV